MRSAACWHGGILPDQPEATREALRRTAANVDLVITSGGVSSGEEDHVRNARLNRLRWASHQDARPYPTIMSPIAAIQPPNACRLIFRQLIEALESAPRNASTRAMTSVITA